MNVARIVIVIAQNSKFTCCGVVVVVAIFFDIIDNFRYISCSASRLHNNLRYFIGICKWLAGVSLCGCGYFFLLSSLELHHLGSISFVSLMI